MGLFVVQRLKGILNVINFVFSYFKSVDNVWMLITNDVRSFYLLLISTHSSCCSHEDPSLRHQGSKCCQFAKVN